MKVYIVGSMRNPEIVKVDNALSAAGHEPFSEWISPGELADDAWQEYARAKGQTYKEASSGPHAVNVFQFDFKHLMEAHALVVVYPAGRSAHVEMGWFGGFYHKTGLHGEPIGRPVYMLMTEQPERFDIMAPQFAAMTGGGIVESVYELLEELKKHASA